MASAIRSAENHFFDWLRKWSSEETKLKKENKTLFYFAAFCVCIVIFGIYCHFLDHGFGMTDESFYLTITDRISKGQSLITDEWHLTQLTALFQYVPFKLFTSITGSTEGIILFMRRVYIAVLFSVYWYIIYKFRKTPVRAIAIAVMFCSYIPMGIKVINYYTLPPALALGICVMLTEKMGKLYRIKLVFAGILISGIVLLVPGFTLVWVAYSVLVLIRLIGKRKKKDILSGYDFVLDIRIWSYMLVGVVISASAFLIYLNKTSGLKSVIDTFPYLFTDAEYDVSVGDTFKSAFLMFHNIFEGTAISPEGKVIIFLWQKVSVAIRDNNRFLCFSALAETVCVFIFIVKKKNIDAQKQETFRKALFCISGITAFGMMVFCLVYKMRHGTEPFEFPSTPPLIISWLCLICYLLCENKDRRVFLFWIVGFVLALSKDIFSDVSLGCGSILCCVAWAFVLPRLFFELFVKKTAGQKKSGSKKTRDSIYNGMTRGLVGSYALMVFCTAIWPISNMYYENRYTTNGEGKEPGSYDIFLDRGPYRGVYCSDEYSKEYNAAISDFDYIRSLSDMPVCIYGIQSWGYIYLDSDYPVYSTFFVDDDIAKRNEIYYGLHPEKRPEIVYISYSPHPSILDNADIDPGRQSLYDKVYADFGWFAGTAIKGRAGIIVMVEAWNQN